MRSPSSFDEEAQYKQIGKEAGETLCEVYFQQFVHSRSFFTSQRPSPPWKRRIRSWRE